LAEKVIESFPGLRGYIGIDLILGKDNISVLDVNARLTTSYIGLRQVAGFNMAKALIEAAATGKIPDKDQLLGVACFSKIQCPTPSAAAYRKAARLSGVISPPFPLIGCAEASALIMGYGDTIGDAQLRLEEAKKSLHSIFSGG
jgi:biotin carboxylase